MVVFDLLDVAEIDCIRKMSPDNQLELGFWRQHFINRTKSGTSVQTGRQIHCSPEY